MSSAIRGGGSENKEPVKDFGKKILWVMKKNGRQRASVIKVGIVKQRGLLRDSVLKEDWR